jgi:hypothetical protein
MGVKRLNSLLREGAITRLPADEPQPVIWFDVPGITWKVQRLMEIERHARGFSYPGMQSSLEGYIRGRLLHPAGLGACVIFITDGTRGKAQSLAKCSTARERRRAWEKEDRKEERALRHGTFGLATEISSEEVERALRAACFALGVPFVETQNEADATLAYLAAQRTGSPPARMSAMGDDGDLLLIPNLTRIAQTSGAARAYVDSATLPSALRARVQAFLRHPAVLPHAPLDSQAALLDATMQLVQPHLPLLAALTNNDFWEYDHVRAMPKYAASSAGRYFGHCLGALRAAHPAVEQALRAASVPLEFAACHVAWELAAGLPAPQLLARLQAAAASEPLCAYAHDHLAGRLDPPELTSKHPAALPGAALLLPSYPGHSTPLSAGAVLVALGLLAPVPGFGLPTPWQLAGSSSGSAATTAAAAAGEEPLQHPLPLPDLRASRVFLTSRRFCPSSAPSLPVLDAALAAPYSPQTHGSFLPNFRDVRAPIRQLHRGLGVPSQQLLQAAQQG